MDCITTKKLITDYSAGLIIGAKKAEMDEHFNSCSECRAELVKLDRIMSLVEGLELREPPAGLWNGVYNRITAETPAQPGLREKFGRLFHKTAARWSLGFVTAALAVMLTFTYTHAPMQNNPSVGTSAFVQGHIASSSQDVLTDEVALNSAAAIADREQAGTSSL